MVSVKKGKGVRKEHECECRNGVPKDEEAASVEPHRVACAQGKGVRKEHECECRNSAPQRNRNGKRGLAPCGVRAGKGVEKEQECECRNGVLKGVETARADQASDPSSHTGWRWVRSVRGGADKTVYGLIQTGRKTDQSSF